MLILHAALMLERVYKITDCVVFDAVSGRDIVQVRLVNEVCV